MIIDVKVPQLSESVCRGHAGVLAQEGGRGRRPRREPDRHRDRQGRAGNAGARCRRAGQDRQGQRRDGHLRRRDRPDRYRSEGCGRCSSRPRQRRRPQPSAAAPSAGAAAGVAMPGGAQADGREGASGRADVTGTGRGGRVTKDDVLAARQAPTAARRAGAGRRAGDRAPSRRCRSRARRSTADAIVAERPEQRVPMSRLRARVAERLVAVAVHQRHPDHLQRGEHGAGDGPAQASTRTSSRRSTASSSASCRFFVKAAVQALQKYPVLNASVDGNDIVYHGYFDIGIAVGIAARPGGADPARRRPDEPGRRSRRRSPSSAPRPRTAS